MTGDADWTIRYHGLDPATVGRNETLCTLGNGYLATRGAAPEARAGSGHYPGTYVAGLYNRLRSHPAGAVSEDESLVNLPNWLPVTFAVDDGPWLAPNADGTLAGLTEHVLDLDLRRGVLTRRMRLTGPGRRTTTVTQRRIVHMGQPHLAALETHIAVADWSGRLRIRSGIDGAVRNTGVARYRNLADTHLTVDRAVPVAESDGEGSDVDNNGTGVVLVAATTNQSHVTVAEVARTLVTVDGGSAGSDRRWVRHATSDSPGVVGHEFAIDVAAGDVVRVEKVVALYTSRDHAISEPVAAAIAAATTAPDFDTLLTSHTAAWERLWDRFPFSLTATAGPRTVPVAPDDLEAVRHAERILRLHLFHLLQTVSPHTVDLDVGVPARGWHGEAYRGHVFWDEVFVLPVLNLRLPGVARALLRYRYRRLDAARRAARAEGHVGAMYPWQSGSDGREESARIHLNPISGRWLPDVTFRQRHVGLAVAYNIWQYYEATGDVDYLIEEGAETLLEIARFFADLARYDPRRGRYVIRGVVGPDEFHTAYPSHTGYPGALPASSPPDGSGPDGAAHGIDNNAYTNVMTVWLMRRVADVLDRLPQWRCDELCDALHLHAADLHRFADVGRRMFVPFHEVPTATGTVPIISQFEGYADLAELDWEACRRRYGDIRRLDRILEAEGDSVNRYQASKQADVLMLCYLLTTEELTRILTDLGYPFSPEIVSHTIDYYLARTSHGSTLSAVVHAWVLARAHRDEALTYFCEALRSDVADVQGGTTAEGVHLAAMAGTATVLQRCFAGIDTCAGTLCLDPLWPARLGTLTLGVRFRGHLLTIHVTGTSATVTSRDSHQPPIRVSCHHQTVTLAPGSTVTFPLPTGHLVHRSM